jgi:hypothetical protein
VLACFWYRRSKGTISPFISNILTKINPHAVVTRQAARAIVEVGRHPMRLRDRFDRLRLKIKETSPSPTPSEIPVNGFFQVPRGLLGKAVPMSLTFAKTDRSDKDDVLRMLLVRDSKTRQRVLKSDLPRLVMKRLTQNTAQSEKTLAR